MSNKTLLVFGEKTFRITVPSNSKITFGPFCPPRKGADMLSVHQSERLAGTLRIYEGKNVVAVFTHVSGYRDISLEYEEQVAKEEGATIWKSDQHGYSRESKVSQRNEWVQPKLGEGKKK